MPSASSSFRRRVLTEVGDRRAPDSGDGDGSGVDDNDNVFLSLMPQLRRSDALDDGSTLAARVALLASCRRVSIRNVSRSEAKSCNASSALLEDIFPSQSFF